MRSSRAKRKLSPECSWMSRESATFWPKMANRRHAVDSRVLLDVQQVIPLPEAEQYQVAVREKSIEQEKVRSTTRDTTRYDVAIGEMFFPNQPKRRLMLRLVSEALRQGLLPERLRDEITWRKKDLFISAPGQADESTFQALYPGKKLRYFFSPDEMFFLGGTTYALSRAWADRTLEAAEKVRALLKNPQEVTWEAKSEVADEGTYQGYLIRRRQSNAIEIERDGRPVLPVIATLRELASQLSVTTLNDAGNPLNTRQLGASVLAAIQLLGRT